MWQKVLTDSQIEILKNLPEEIKGHFVLGGGTCLNAFYIAHRKSDDLDFFERNKLNISFSDLELSLKKKFNIQRSSKIFDRKIFQILDVKLEFVPCYFNRLNDIEKNYEFDIFLESINDIAANKIIAMTDRQEIKDYVDIYFICKNKGINFMELLLLAKKKYNAAYEYLLNFDNLNEMKDDFEMIKFLDKEINFKNLLDFYNKCKVELEKYGIEKIWKNLET